MASLEARENPAKKALRDHVDYPGTAASQVIRFPTALLAPLAREDLRAARESLV